MNEQSPRGVPRAFAFLPDPGSGAEGSIRRRTSRPNPSGVGGRRRTGRGRPACSCEGLPIPGRSPRPPGPPSCGGGRGPRVAELGRPGRGAASIRPAGRGGEGGQFSSPRRAHHAEADSPRRRLKSAIAAPSPLAKPCPDPCRQVRAQVPWKRNCKTAKCDSRLRRRERTVTLRQDARRNGVRPGGPPTDGTVGDPS